VILNSHAKFENPALNFQIRRLVFEIPRWFSKSHAGFWNSGVRIQIPALIFKTLR